MEDDAGVKAPVTRLRRRMSVEKTEENKSPALNTPTKKRAGRLAAKPDLELIDENTPESNLTRNTKKSATKDVTESEEKTLTPSRRSTRIKSNSSILSETAVDVNSPRARRAAARKVSQAGSDSEATVTPVRQTRRTRKDSTSSIEREPQLPAKSEGKQVTEPIPEETETNLKKSIIHSDTSNDASEIPTNVRKSPRLLKKGKKVSPTNTETLSHDEKLVNYETKEPKRNDQETEVKNDDTSKELVTSIPPASQDITNIPISDQETSQRNKLSISSDNLINELDTTQTRKIQYNLNKTMPAAENIPGKTKRKRTKSWTTMTVSDGSNFFSDNESNKRKLKDNIKSPLIPLNKSGSGDNFNLDKSNKTISKSNSGSFIVEKINDSPEKGKETSNDKISKSHNISVNNTEDNLPKSDDKMLEECVITSELLTQKPSGDIKSTVFIDDSDSNSGKVVLKSRHENEDQCVPVIEHPGDVYQQDEKEYVMSSHNIKDRKESEEKKVIINNSCEPMDVDETIPENMIHSEIKNNELNVSDTKSLSVKEHDNSKLSNIERVNKSQRKSSMTANLDKSGNESKSTLILSQLKDASLGDINDVVQSSQVSKNILLSKTADELNVTQESDDKKNQSTHYSTSTPLQDKNIQKFKGLHVNTSIIKTNEIRKDTLVNDSGSSDEDIDKPNQPLTKKNKPHRKKSITDDTLLKNNSKNSLKRDDEDIDDKTKEDSSNKIMKSDDMLKHDISNAQRSNNMKTDSKEGNKSLKENNVRLTAKLQKIPKKSKSVTSSEEESEEEMETDENSQRTNDFINDEAKDAGDDYESGDSQDESEREYENENEIIDKGETLSTEEDFSDDSDYEKDSFVVSSNEDDVELLEGTDDDLSMTDNELKMTTKSKKKFNERKLKEQKKASREMYEARHEINTSSKSSNSIISKSKKNKRQQIESSSESEEESSIKPKNNRMRLNSTKESITLENRSEDIKNNKKNKSFSDSVCNMNVEDEKEITILNENMKEKDPLLSHIKQEPKTPHKSANSTIAFIDSENTDQIKENESIRAQTELDPLYTTMTNHDDDNDDDDEYDDSLSSSDENIKQNYDSVLRDLNKSSIRKGKVNDISLNLDRKTKKKEKTAIIDELNLTQVKYVKKPKNNTTNDENSKCVKNKAEENKDDEASSDSIDLHLLFSEESNNSDEVQNKMNDEMNTSIDRFIPLKKTEGKTDIREEKVKNRSMDESLNKSLNKKDNKHKSQPNDNNSNTEEENGVSFFIDTVGSYGETRNKSKSPKNTSESSDSDSDDGRLQIDETVTNNNEAQIDVAHAESETGINENSDDDTPIEVSYKKENSSAKRKSKQSPQLEEDVTLEQAVNETSSKTPASQKKKKRQLDARVDEKNYIEQPVIESAPKTPASQKKKSKKAELIIDSDKDISKDNLVSLFEMNTSGSKKQQDHSKAILVEDSAADNTNTKKKRKRMSSPTTKTDEIVHEDVNNSANLDLSIVNSQKKRKISPQSETILDAENAVKNQKSLSSKMKNKEPESQIKLQNDASNKNRSKKRKEREDDFENQHSKMLKENTFDKVPRLPPSLLMKLDDKPKKDVPVQKVKVISTAQFKVEEVRTRRNKPSKFLEESVYLNDFDDESKQKKRKKHFDDKPRVLPFVPTASTSSSGYTSVFKVNVIPSEIKFVAQANTTSSFRDNYLYSNKIKRLGTYDLYKRQRSAKMSKF